MISGVKAADVTCDETKMFDSDQKQLMFTSNEKEARLSQEDNVTVVAVVPDSFEVNDAG